MGWASESFRLVLVDSPPALNLADFELIAASCESVMVVARARKTPRESLAKVLAQVIHERSPEWFSTLPKKPQRMDTTGTRQKQALN